ncbi:MAG: hypothetical protein KC897_12140 [Candidatus Omnitrophica bacterium]|nr:hypothetical protein [Candidatus Omnitrophota bacterium]MCB9720298.1 hypothetical protein [Candidatus Omnitrophota bacterium]
MLIGLVSPTRTINYELLRYAARQAPALVVDCANAADPHRLYPEFPHETLGQIYVIELELLYKFRDILKNAPRYAARVRARTVVVTTCDYLFHYQDPEENRDIHHHCWELMRGLGQTYDVRVGILAHSEHLEFAQKYCDRVESQIINPNLRIFETSPNHRMTESRKPRFDQLEIRN